MIIPVLRSAFQMNPVLAVGTTSICASLMKVNAAALHIKMGNVHWQKSLLMLTGAIPATYLTTSFIIQLTQNPDTTGLIDSTINYMIIAVIVFSLASMVYKDMKGTKKQPEQREQSDIHTKKGIMDYIQPALAGAGSGVVIGATGFGGGVLLLPILTVLLRVNIKQAVGSSIVIALLLSSLSALTYSGGGQADMVTASILIEGSLIGVPVAGKMVKLVSGKALHRLTLILITLSALMMMSSALG